MRARYSKPWVILSALILTSGILAGAADAETTVLLVRHAEKQGGPDPHLTPEGVERAKVLVDVAPEVTAVYATETCRTVQTVQFLAAKHGLTVQVQDFGPPGLSMDHCQLTVPVDPLPADVDSEAAMAAHILTHERGGTVVIAGHSNTVPALVEAFGAGSLCPDYFPFNTAGKCHIPDEGEASQFDNLFLLTLPDEVRMIKAKYGE